MSVLSIDHNNFDIRYGDLADTVRVYIKITSPSQSSLEDSMYGVEVMNKIEEAIKAMPKAKLSGHDIRRIIKSVLGIDMNVRYVKAEYPKGYQLCQYFAIKDPSQDPNNYDEDLMFIAIPGTPYFLHRIHISTRMNRESPQEGFVY